MLKNKIMLSRKKEDKKQLSDRQGKLRSKILNSIHEIE